MEWKVQSLGELFFDGREERDSLLWKGRMEKEYRQISEPLQFGRHFLWGRRQGHFPCARGGKGLSRLVDAWVSFLHRGEQTDLRNTDGLPGTVAGLIETGDHEFVEAPICLVGWFSPAVLTQAGGLQSDCSRFTVCLWTSKQRQLCWWMLQLSWKQQPS